MQYDGMTTELLHMREPFSWRFLNPGRMDRMGWAGMDWELRVYICYLNEMKYECVFYRLRRLLCERRFGSQRY